MASNSQPQNGFFSKVDPLPIDCGFEFIGMAKFIEISDAYFYEKNKKQIEFQKTLFSKKGLNLLFGFKQVSQKNLEFSGRNFRAKNEVLICR